MTEAEATTRRDRAPSGGRAMLREAIARKVLLGWAQNRLQVAVPLSLDLARLPPDQARLVAAAMLAALLLTGPPAPERQRRLEAALARAGGAPPPDPPDLLPLLEALERAGLGAHAYAASLLVLDRREAAARSWLDLLAARFGLPAETVRGLVRRHRR
jgi:hypothetical protein